MALKYDDIKKEFQDAVNNDKIASKLYAQIRNGDASYATSGQLAQRIGADLGKVLMNHAPVQSIDEWDVDDLIPKALGLDHRMVTTACKQVQENMNKDAGVGIKYKEPKFNQDKAYGIAKELHDNPDFTNIQKTFCDQLENFSRSVADDSIVANADVMWGAGIKTMVVRIAEGGCCKWCSEMAGVYDYAEVREPGNDVWRRHENCNCTIDFYTERNGSVQRERVKEGGKSETLKNNEHSMSKDIEKTVEDNSLKERANQPYKLSKKVKNSSDCPTIKLSKKEYGHVQHELTTHLTAEEKKYPVVIKDIGDYTYTVEVLGDEQYRIIGKRPIK